MLQIWSFTRANSIDARGLRPLDAKGPQLDDEGVKASPVRRGRYMATGFEGDRPRATFRAAQLQSAHAEFAIRRLMRLSEAFRDMRSSWQARMDRILHVACGHHRLNHPIFAREQNAAKGASGINE